MNNLLDISIIKGPNLTSRLEILLRKNIEEGVWKEKEYIPTELEIASECKLSRNTVRTSIQRLVNDGMLVRIKGRGTFVASPKASVPIGVACIRETIHRAKPTPIARIVREEFTIPPTSVAKAFGLPEDQKLYYIERARYQMIDNSSPVMYHYTWVLPEYGAKIVSSELVVGRITDQLRDKCHIEALRIKERLSAVGANLTESKELGVLLGSPMLLLEEQRFDQQDRLYTLARFAIIPSLLELNFEHFNTE